MFFKVGAISPSMEILKPWKLRASSQFHSVQLYRNTAMDMHTHRHIITSVMFDSYIQHTLKITEFYDL